MSGVCAAYAAAGIHRRTFTTPCPSCQANAYVTVSVGRKGEPVKPHRDPKVDAVQASPSCACNNRDELVKVALDRLVAEAPA